MAFNQVVFKRNVTATDTVLNISVHPFRVLGSIYLMEAKGRYGLSHLPELSLWQKTLADALWDEIPGLSSVCFQNGSIQLFHAGLFSAEAIMEAAEAIIRPALESQLALQALWTEDTA